MTVGERIKEARVRKGMTQQDVADAIGTTYQNISQYERDVRKAKMVTLNKIANVLGVNIWDLDNGYRPIDWSDPIENDAGDCSESGDVDSLTDDLQNEIISKSHNAKSPTNDDILYISRPSGDTTTDELRRQLHDLIDQLDDEDLQLMSGLMIRFKR